MCKAAEAVLEHLFNNHSLCDPTWCHVREKEIRDEMNLRENNEEADNGAKVPPTHPFKHRCKIIDADLYQQMRVRFEPFLLPDRLLECLHIYTTQCNEAMNNSIAKYAPKSRTYSSSMSLSHRVAIATGIFNLGFYNFWSRVYTDLGMAMTSALTIHLRSRDSAISNKREYQKNLSVKRRRVQKRNELTNDLIQKQIADKKRGSTYGCGVALVDLVPEGVRKEEMAIKTMLECKCELFGCYGSAHKTKTSKRCKYHTCSSQDEVDTAMYSFLRHKYPKYYNGENYDMIFVILVITLLLWF